MLLKNKGRLKGYTSKAKKENESKAHPDAFADLNKIKAPKELSQQLENNYVRYRAGELGIDLTTVVTGLPVDEFTLESLQPKSKLENKTPFKVDGKHQIAIDNDEELLD
ncbi:hypothetical protein [Paraflavitalea speifideaquila]|uniref:hypothetical protein n=1 Tax=Paraflavitalea speifideaquila TaxID=3076558 RepID=UPI0028EC9FDB|nr:hypothetical protein [Paraflavitalea speifideiaquila]